MTIFYLVRHADAEWTPDEQRPLSPKGQRDAQQVADRLCHYPITRIYSSPYLRAKQTISPLAEELGLPVDNEPDLRERKLGDESSVKDFFSAVKQAWSDPSFAYSGGESNTGAQRRGVAVVKRLDALHSGQHLVLSTHGNLLALVLQHYDQGIDYVFWKALTMPDIYELKLEGGRAAITRLWKSQR